MIRERTDDTAELIATLRSLIRVIVGEGDYEPDSVDVVDVLEAELAAARQRFPDAEFAFADAADAGDEGDALRVLADDLLGDLFENLLANAVERYDGAVRAENRAGGGVSVEVTLPRASASTSG